MIIQDGDKTYHINDTDIPAISVNRADFDVALAIVYCTPGVHLINRVKLFRYMFCSLLKTSEPALLRVKHAVDAAQAFYNSRSPEEIAQILYSRLPQ